MVKSANELAVSSTLRWMGRISPEETGTNIIEAATKFFITQVEQSLNPDEINSRALLAFRKIWKESSDPRNVFPGWKEIPRFQIVSGEVHDNAVKYMAGLDSFFVSRYISESDQRTRRIADYLRREYQEKGWGTGWSRRELKAFGNRFGETVEELGIEAVRTIIDTGVGRARVWSTLDTLARTGFATFTIGGPVDNLTCRWCALMRGRTFKVAPEFNKMTRMVSEGRENREAFEPFFVNQYGTNEKFLELKEMGSADIQNAGTALPPYHGRCRHYIHAGESPQFNPKELPPAEVLPPPVIPKKERKKKADLPEEIFMKDGDGVLSFKFPDFKTHEEAIRQVEKEFGSSLKIEPNFDIRMVNQAIAGMRLYKKYTDLDFKPLSFHFGVEDADIGTTRHNNNWRGMFSPYYLPNGKDIKAVIYLHKYTMNGNTIPANIETVDVKNNIKKDIDFLKEHKKELELRIKMGEDLLKRYEKGYTAEDIKKHSAIQKQLEMFKEDYGLIDGRVTELKGRLKLYEKLSVIKTKMYHLGNDFYLDGVASSFKTMVHELAHAYHLQNNRRVVDVLGERYNYYDYADKRPAPAAERVSGYGSTQPGENFPEAVSAYLMGQHTFLTGKMIKFFDSIFPKLKLGKVMEKKLNSIAEIYDKQIEKIRRTIWEAAEEREKRYFEIRNAKRDTLGQRIFIGNEELAKKFDGYYEEYKNLSYETLDAELSKMPPVLKASELMGKFPGTQKAVHLRFMAKVYQGLQGVITSRARDLKKLITYQGLDTKASKFFSEKTLDALGESLPYVDINDKLVRFDKDMYVRARALGQAHLRAYLKKIASAPKNSAEYKEFKRLTGETEFKEDLKINLFHGVGYPDMSKMRVMNAITDAMNGGNPYIKVKEECVSTYFTNTEVMKDLSVPQSMIIQRQIPLHDIMYWLASRNRPWIHVRNLDRYNTIHYNDIVKNAYFDIEQSLENDGKSFLKKKLDKK